MIFQLPMYLFSRLAYTCSAADVASLPAASKGAIAIVIDEPGVVYHHDDDDWKQHSLNGAPDSLVDEIASDMAALSAMWQALRNQVLYVQTGTQTVANTAAETSMLNGGKGNLNFPANATHEADFIRIKLMGYVSCGATGREATLRVKYGAATIIESVFTLPSGLTEQLFDLEIVSTVRSIGAEGTVFVQGRSIIRTGTAGGVTMRELKTTAPAVIDTTVPNTVALTYQWTTAAAANVLVVTNATIELMRPAAYII